MNAASWAIRIARPDDEAAIDAVIRAAFAASKMGHQGETELRRTLQSDGDVLLSLVADRGGAAVGHALFSRMKVHADGTQWHGAGLGPIAVLPGQQNSGIGSALIRDGLDRLAADGIQISFVLGHPGYYPRFGYRPELAAPFASPFAGPHFMALLLDKTLQIPKSGRADYAAAFSR